MPPRCRRQPREADAPRPRRRAARGESEPRPPRGAPRESPARPARRPRARRRATARPAASGEARSPVRPPTSSTFTLWISRTRGTCIAAACARSRSAASDPACGSTCTTTSASGSARSDGVLDGVRRRVSLRDGRPGRDADHDVGEVPPGRLAHAQAGAGRRRGRIALDRPARRGRGVGRRAVHEYVDVPPHQSRRRHEHEQRDEECGDRVGVRTAGARHERGRRAPRASRRSRSRSGARSTAAPRSRTAGPPAGRRPRARRRSRSRRRRRRSAYHVGSTRGSNRSRRGDRRPARR